MAKKKSKIVKIEEERKDSHYLADGSRSEDQLIAPSAIRYTSEHELKIENNFARSFVINGYPSRVQVGWLSDFYGYKGDMDTSVFITPSNERTALDELTQNLKRVRLKILHLFRASWMLFISKEQSLSRIMNLCFMFRLSVRCITMTLRLLIKMLRNFSLGLRVRKCL